jgi:hypothetical protein
MWNNRDPIRGLVRTWYVQEPEMTTLCNKKWIRTWTIFNVTSYSMYTWAIACPTEAPTSVAAPCHVCQNSSMTVCFSSQIKTLLRRLYQIRHRCASVTRLIWQTVFHYKFVTKLKLWPIWLLQWRNLFFVEVDISNSELVKLLLSPVVYCWVEAVRMLLMKPEPMGSWCSTQPSTN